MFKFIDALVFNPSIKGSTQVVLFSSREEGINNIKAGLRIKIGFRWYTIVSFERIFDERYEDCVLVTLNVPLKHTLRMGQCVYFGKQ